MIPYTYNMVSFRGTDLSEINGEAVDGIYGDILSAMNECGIVVLYDWKFAGIPVTPAYCTIEEGDSFILINGIIKIKDDDTVWIESLVPPEPVLVELIADENGQFSPQDYDADGFSEVTVDVPQPEPVIESLSVSENGTYNVPTGVDGYGPVVVDVPTGDDLSKLAFKTGSDVVFSQGQATGFTTSANVVRVLNPDNGSDSFLNFSNPFEINIRFKVSSYLQRSQVLCGNTANFYRQPSIEVGSAGNLWCGISSNGSSWTYSLALGDSVPTNTWCEVNLKYDGSLATLKLKIGETVASTDISVSSVYNTISSYELGGIANSGNHCATNVTIDLTKTYIKINNSLVWGVQ